MANITTTEVGDSIPTIVAAEALGALKANTVLARLVNRNYENEVATKGNVVKIPYGGALSVNDKVVNTVVTLQAPNDSAYTLTLNKHKEISFLVEDPAKAFASVDWVQVYIADAMKALGEQIDGDIAALYTGFSQSIDATGAGGPLDKADFREARRLLNSAKCPVTERYAVLHEDAEYAFLNITEATNRDYTEALGQAKLDGSVGRFMGFDVMLDQKIAVAATECKNLFFHRDAIVFATRPLPQAPAGVGVAQTTMAEDGVGLRVTTNYDPNNLGLKITIDVLYGVAELRDAFGVVVRTTEI